MDKRTIPAPQAKKIRTASKRVAEHRATNAGALRSVFDALGSMVKLLADIQVEADQAIWNEVRIMREVARRFRKKVETAQQAKSGGLLQASEGIARVERALKALESPTLKRLIQETERDLRLVRQLRGNLDARSQEAAFVLAELEQAADPLPGLQIASAKHRKENRDRRKLLASQPLPEVELKPDTLTSQPLERSETP